MRVGLVAALALCACQDEGKEQLAEAKARYGALLAKGAPAQSKEFDAVLEALEQVPARSRARPEAEALIAAIASARQAKVERPLAVGATPLPDLGVPELQGDLEATRAECVRRVKELGPLEGEARNAKAGEVAACQRRLDALVRSLEHVHEDGGAAHP